MKQTALWFALVGLLLFAVGCGGKPSAPVSKLPAEVPGGGPPPENRPVAAAGGGAPATVNSPPAEAGEGASGEAPQPEVPEEKIPTDIFGTPIRPRERPVAAAGGGGGGGATVAAGSRPGNAPAGNRPAGNSSGVTSIGLANGLYPQGVTGRGSAAGGGGVLSGGLVNGLYPQGVGGNSGTPDGTNNLGSAAGQPGAALTGNTAGATSPAGKSAEFFESAKQLFDSGDENAAAQNLYAYMLAREDAFEEYPLMWFTGLKEPRVFLRVGIGVTYTRPRDFSGKPPVIGDPVAEERGGGRRGNAPPAGGDDILGASGANPGAGTSASSSPYASVDTGTPAGFLLYYTGDYIEKLYQELNSRRKGNQTKFGKLLAQFPDRGRAVATAQGQPAQPAAPPPGGPPNRPTMSVGGGAGGGTQPAGGGGGTAGPAGGGQPPNAAGRGARNTRKLVDLWSGSDASPPDRVTKGTLTPGVMCLGEGKKDELVTRAKKYGVDVLLLFDVKIAESRGENQSNTTLRLFNVAQPDEQLALGRQLRNGNVMAAREDGKADPVEVELSRVVEEYMDRNLVAEELPKSLTADHVVKRVDVLLAGEVDVQLRAAVEVLGFYRLGLLSEDKVLTALNQLLGEDAAEAILNGNENERVTALKKLITED